MAAPTYEWVCPHCGSDNVAYTESCARCSKAAAFKAADLPRPIRATGEAQPDNAEVGATLLIFFPEAIPACLVALYGPFWAIKALTSGHVWQALGLLAAEGLCGYLFVRTYMLGFKWLAYACMVAFMLVAVAVGALG